MRTAQSLRYFKEIDWQNDGLSARKITLGAKSSAQGSEKPKPLEISIHNNVANLEEDWRELERHSNISIYQRFDWISAYLEQYFTSNPPQPLIVSARLDGKLVFVLPLMVLPSIIRKVGWIGGTHSNYNFAVFDESFAQKISPDDVRMMFAEITRMLGGFGYLKLCCQPKIWNSKANPLLAMPFQYSTNHAFGVDLRGSFDQVLAQGNAKRKRKKYRWQVRQLEPLGGAELVEATDKASVLEILNCFHNQKSKRLHNMGVKDVFGSVEAQNFLRKIALDSCDMDEPLLKLFALKVDGKYRAICGGGVNGPHFSAYFISFADDELAYISPGEMLIYLMVQQLVKSDFESMDMGSGEERYKQSWCPQTIEMVDIILPLSRTSRGLAHVVRFLLNMRRAIRQSPLAWETYKKIRMILARK